MLWVRCSFIHLKYSLRKEKADSGYPLPANVRRLQFGYFALESLYRNGLQISGKKYSQFF